MISRLLEFSHHAIEFRVPLVELRGTLFELGRFRLGALLLCDLLLLKLLFLLGMCLLELALLCFQSLAQLIGGNVLDKFDLHAGAAREIDAEPVPYDMRIGFFDAHTGAVGKQVALGWQVDLGDSVQER